MKKYFLLITAVFVLISSLAAQDDHEAEIMAIRGKWSKHGDNNGRNDPDFASSQVPLVTNKTEQMLSLLKQAYPDPVGMEVFSYSSISFNPLFKGAPAAYELAAYYMLYYYNTPLKKILVGTETGTTIRIEANRFGWFLEEAREWMIDGNMTMVYYLLEPDGQWKGLPCYKLEHWAPGSKGKPNKDRTVLVARDGKLPYKPLTQKQYLLALKYKTEKEIQDIYSNSDKQEKNLLKGIEDTKNNKFMDAATKEKLIASFEKMLADNRKNGNTDAKKLAEGFEKQIKSIDQYLNSHSEQELQQPAITNSPWKFNGSFTEGGQKRMYHLVQVDPSYFKKNLPRHIPQFFVIYWKSDQARPAVESTKQFEEKFSLESLKAMIDRNTDKPNLKPAFVKTDPANDPELKAITKKAQLYADSMIRMKPKIPASTAATKPDTDTTNYRIPARNERFLAAIPKNKLTSIELKKYLEKIDKKYSAILQSVGAKLPDITTLSAEARSNASTLLLLQGMGEQAAWMAIKAAVKAPGNLLVLNNAGAVLNGCGFQPVAVPILETALGKSPGNSTIQNNLGQSYIALGDVQKATQYLQQTLSTSPYHPHANYSLARIYQAKGDNANALKYTENSLRGSFNDKAWHLLYKLKKNARLMDYMKKHYAPPDYFNEDKYHVPRQCEKVSEIGLLKGEYAAFHDMIDKVIRKFKSLEDEENELGRQSLMNRVKNYKSSDILRTPFTELGTAMVLDIGLRLTDQWDEVTRAQHIYNKQIKELTAAYDVARSGTSDCGELLGLANRYMELMAYATREYQKKWLPIFKEYFTDMMYWGRFAAADKHLQGAVYAGSIRSYLGVLKQLAETHFLETTQDCSIQDEIKKTQEDYKLPEFDCPIEQDINVIVGSMYIDCEKIEYHLGLLMPVDIVHTIKNHNTTIAIGLGLDFKFGGERLKAGPIQGGFSGGAKMQYFLSFDGTHPSDQGLIWDAKIKYSQKLDTRLESGIEELDEIGTTSVDLSARTVLSVHNGYGFSGSFYDKMDKILEMAPEKQINKNVDIYQPNR